MDYALYHRNRLTQGELHIGGDFHQKSGSSWSFAATNEHRVVLAGVEEQRVSFADPIRSGFARARVANEQVVFETPVRGFALAEDMIVNVPLRRAFEGFTRTMDLSGHRLIVHSDMVFTHAGTLRLSGGSLYVLGALIQPEGRVYLDGGSLVVSKDYRVESPSGDGGWSDSHAWRGLGTRRLGR